MRTIFSTESMHPRDRFEYWHELMERAIVPHECSAAQPDLFAAEIKADTLCDLPIIAHSNSAMTVGYDRRHMAAAGDDCLLLVRPTSGAMAVEQAGRDVRLGARAMTVIDPAAPYTARFSQDSTVVVIKLDRRALEARTGAMSPLTASALEPTHGVRRLLSDLVGGLAETVCALEASAAEPVRNHLLELVAQSIVGASDRMMRQSTARAVAEARLRAAIEMRLSDHALDSEKAAHAAGMSVRYANALLETHGTSVARMIREMRLARCRAALADPAQAARTIGEIAYGWGFSDLTNFGRAFRAAYGATPRAFRRAAALERHGGEFAED